ncbi:MAG: SSU ribosomal protein S20p, partial [uncultured Sphingomonas sp.]
GEHAASQEAHPSQRPPHRGQRRARGPHPDLHQGGGERSVGRGQDGSGRGAEEGTAGARPRGCARSHPQEHGVAEVLPADQTGRFLGL